MFPSFLFLSFFSFLYISFSFFLFMCLLSTSHSLFSQFIHFLSLFLSHTNSSSLSVTIFFISRCHFQQFSLQHVKNDDILQENDKKFSSSIRSLRFALLLSAYLDVTSITFSIFRFSTNTLLSFPFSVFFSSLLSSFYPTLPHSSSPLSCTVFLHLFPFLHSTHLLTLLLALFFLFFLLLYFLTPHLHCTALHSLSSI
jgi:hypothetical protein